MTRYNFKGGRTAQIPMRFTPEEKATLQAAAAHAGMSMSDFVMMMTMKYVEVADEEQRLEEIAANQAAKDAMW